MKKRFPNWMLYYQTFRPEAFAVAQENAILTTVEVDLP